MKQAYLLKDEESSSWIKFFLEYPKHLEDCYEISREEKYDTYSELGYVPYSVLLSDGWDFECFYCYKIVNNEHWDYDEDEEINPVIEDRKVFCCQECSDSYYKEKEYEKQLLEQCKESILRQYGNVVLSKGYVGREGVYYEFTWHPTGLKAQYQYNIETKEEQVFIARKDQTLWAETYGK